MVLTDSPSSTPLQLDWDATVAVALDNRPDLLRRRLGIHVAELQLLVARNGYRPRLDLDGRYGKNGMASDLGGSLGQIGGGEFEEWQLGVTFSTTLQRHVGIGGIREAELTIARERAFLQNDVLIATTEVADAMRRIDWVQKQYVVAAERVAAVREWRKGAQARFNNPPADLSLVLALELYLRNLQALTESSLAANQLLSEFNNAQARLEEVKGTILESHTVVVQRDPSKEALKELGPTDRELVPQELPPGDPQGTRPRQPGVDGQAVELKDFRLPRHVKATPVALGTSSPTPASEFDGGIPIIDGDARESAVTGTTPWPRKTASKTDGGANVVPAPKSVPAPSTVPAPLPQNSVVDGDARETASSRFAPPPAPSGPLSRNDKTPVPSASKIPAPSSQKTIVDGDARDAAQSRLAALPRPASVSDGDARTAPAPSSQKSIVDGDARDAAQSRLAAQKKPANVSDGDARAVSTASATPAPSSQKTIVDGDARDAAQSRLAAPPRPASVTDGDTRTVTASSPQYPVIIDGDAREAGLIVPVRPQTARRLPQVEPHQFR